MILTPEIEQKIISAIKAEPDRALVLPDHAYGSNGRVIVLIDGLPIDLHRHLHEVLIRPLGHHERMHDTSGVEGNVNPHLFRVIAGKKSPNTHCPSGHAYEGNEMPPNSRGYRCRTCYLNSRPKGAGTANRDKTHCPYGHEYAEGNTIHDSTGRRRCRTCRNSRNRRYMANRRKENR